MSQNPLRAFLRRAAIFFSITGLFLSIASPLQAQQFRAAWVDVFHNGMQNSAQVDAMISSLVAGHYNVAIVEVLAYMDNGSSTHGAYWNSSIIPHNTYVTSGFDPLAYVCQKAHANGIEVHAWIGGSGGGMYRASSTWPPAGNTTLAAHPEWLMVPLAYSETGVITNLDGNFLLDMGSPDVQEYIISVVRELVTNYEIDGINWDDEINSTGYTQGYGYPITNQTSYARSGLARYRLNTGATGTPSNTDATWSNYRRRFKNELMARTQAEIESIKTNPRQPLRHTSAALAYSPVPTTCTFSGSEPYLYFCDWAGMMQNGWLDAVIPQTYSSSTFTNWADKIASCWQYNRQIFPGLGAYLTNFATIYSQLQYAMTTKGLKGAATYSYSVAAITNASGWWNFIGTNYYTNVVTTPTMPWRNTNTATEGILWGRVTSAATGLTVDDATVVVASGSTVKTDGNGYYIATLVPAVATGTVHSTGASKTGIGAQTNATAVALAGDVARYDFILGYPPGITTQPISRTNNPGTTATFTVAATNTGLSYIWRKNAAPLFNGGNITGAATATLSLTGVFSTDAASYSVIVSNIYGVMTSSSATLAVTVAPAISTTPQSQTNIAGANPMFTVAATGTAPLAYQWQFNSGNISGATATSFTRTNIQSSSAGSYAVVITNVAGSITSAPAILTVLLPPSITTAPGNLALAAGATASFSVVAGGATPFSYQWRFNNTAITDATDSAYFRPNVHTADAGTYSITITNVAGSISTNALLTVNNPPSLSVASNLTVHAGAKVTVTNAATDSDLPAQTLTFNLTTTPAGSSITAATGIFTWLTADTDLNTTNPVTVRVVDSGNPALSATNTFTVTVVQKPTLQETTLSHQVITLNWTAIIGDSYRVQYKTNIEDAVWVDLATIPATNTIASCTDSTLGSSARYYRILLVQ